MLFFHCETAGKNVENAAGSIKKGRILRGAIVFRAASLIHLIPRSPDQAGKSCPVT